MDDDNNAERENASGRNHPIEATQSVPDNLDRFASTSEYESENENDQPHHVRAQKSPPERISDQVKDNPPHPLPPSQQNLTMKQMELFKQNQNLKEKHFSNNPLSFKQRNDVMTSTTGLKPIIPLQEESNRTEELHDFLERKYEEMKTVSNSKVYSEAVFSAESEKNKDLNCVKSYFPETHVPPPHPRVNYPADEKRSSNINPLDTHENGDQRITSSGDSKLFLNQIKEQERQKEEELDRQENDENIKSFYVEKEDVYKDQINELRSENLKLKRMLEDNKKAQEAKLFKPK